MDVLATIAGRLAERNLPMLLIGVHAVIAHGYKELFLKHGKLEDYERIRRATGRRS